MTLCKCIVPMIIGFIRAFGRASETEPALFSRIFPAPTNPVIKYVHSPATVSTPAGSFNTFRPIIPRSLSSNYMSSSELLVPNNSTDHLDNKNERTLQSQSSIPYNPQTYFFFKYGSSFGKIVPIGTEDFENPLKLNINHLQAILAIVSITNISLSNNCYVISN